MYCVEIDVIYNIEVLRKRLQVSDAEHDIIYFHFTHDE